MRSDGPGGDGEPAPLGFKILIAAAAVYLLIRAIQLIVWLGGRLL